MHDWLKRHDKYHSHEIQNEILKIIALRIVSDFSRRYQKEWIFFFDGRRIYRCFNKEQLAICLRHVDHNLVAHEEFIILL